MTRPALLALAAASALAAPGLARAAHVVIVNADPPGVGFNDPTPVAPLATNPATTKGAQALNVFQRAADLWGAALDSNVEIRVYATFVKLTCTATTATLGSAGALFAESDFPGAPYPGTWYPIALANKLAGEDLVPAEDDPDFGGADIRARFNSGIGAPDCLASTSWYYGLDTGHAANQINLLTVVLHEVGHGLGFASFANVATGAWFAGQPDAYSRHYYDVGLGKGRLEMTQAERAASAVSGQIVWNGPTVTANYPAVLSDTPTLWVDAPASVAGTYAIGTASFGAPLTREGVAGTLALASYTTAGGATSIDACAPITSDVAGRVALLQRGTCAFAVKAKNAQDAGAIGVVVINSTTATTPPGMSGSDPSVVIPVVSVTYADGVKLYGALGAGVQVRLGLDPSRRAGTLAGRVKLYSPNPVEVGSSVSHFDVSATPNLLMEPAINADLRIAVGLPYDLTRSQLRDVGWYPDADLDLVADDAGDQCLGSDLRATVHVGATDTGVPNPLDASGCTLADRVNACTGATHGAYVACVVAETSGLAPGDQGAIRAVAAGGAR